MPPLPAPIHENRYISAEVCAAVGISESTLKNWVSRKPQVVLMTSEERERVGKGVPFLFSFQRVMQVALVAELVALGLEPRPSAMAAAGFTDVGDAGRDPGHLFPEGLTYLFAHKDNPDSLPGTCINIKPQTSFVEVRHRLYGAVSFVAADVNAVHARVCAALA